MPPCFCFQFSFIVRRDSYLSVAFRCLHFIHRAYSALLKWGSLILFRSVILSVCDAVLWSEGSAVLWNMIYDVMWLWCVDVWGNKANLAPSRQFRWRWETAQQTEGHAPGDQQPTTRMEESMTEEWHLAHLHITAPPVGLPCPAACRDPAAIA